MAKAGLGEKLKNLFAGKNDKQDFYEDFEDMMIEADLGAGAAMEISDLLREKIRAKRSFRQAADC